MFQPQFFYEAGKARSGTALIPFFDSTSVSFAISTRNGNTVVDWGDGSSSNIAPVKMRDYADGSALSSNFNKSYSSALNGNVSVKFLRGLKDVYSIFLGVFHDNNQKSKLNILDVETFFHQFPNLFSIYINEYAYGDSSRMSVIKGDLAKFPNSVERVLIGATDFINSATDLVLNFSSYTNASNLKFFSLGTIGGTSSAGGVKVIGDLSKFPTSCQFLNVTRASSGSAITYTAGKVWASSFDTLHLPISLTIEELDSLLIDMDNSINTKIGSGVISIGGYRSAVSDAAVASLQTKGFTVNINKQLGFSILDSSVIFRADFQNNFDVYSNSYLGAIAGGTSNQPTFALSGRKAGEYCAVFNGSKSIKTTTNLPINSDKVTIAFWMKTTQSATAIIVETTTDYSVNNAFAVIMRASVKIDFADNLGIALNIATSSSLSNNWKHIVIVSDRSQPGINQTKLYVNGILDSLNAPTANNNGNWINAVLHIGQRAGTSLGFVGSLMYKKIYNYPFTPSEVSTLYNSEL